MNTVTKEPVARHRGVRRVTAAFCLALILVLQAFASSGPLHKLLHADADSPDHHCAITLIAHGLVDAAVVCVSVAGFVAAVLFRLPGFEAPDFCPFDYRLSPSRAPPLS
jgi:hypothetical protein